MACGKDQGCLRIANSTYPGLQAEINGSINTITNNINEIMSVLNSLSIPDDYLGSKVKTRVNSICSSLSSDEGEVSSISGNINSFVSSKIKEHQEHYNMWKTEQQRKLQAKKEKEKETKV